MNRGTEIVLALVVCAGVATDSLAQSREKAIFVTNNQGISQTVSSLRIGADGRPTLVGTYYGGRLPTDCVLSDGGQFLLVVNGETSQSPAELHTLRVASDGSLSEAWAPVAIDDGSIGAAISKHNVVLVASPVTDSLRSFRLTASGLQAVDVENAGAFAARPVVSRDGLFAWCVGPNGTDDIVQYSLTPTGELTRLGSLDVPGTGAYSAVLHPEGNAMYIATGMGNTVRLYDVNTSTGGLSFMSETPLGGMSVVEMAIAPQGDCLYSAHVLSDTLRVSMLSPDGSLTATSQSYLVRADLRDVVTDGQNVWVTDESVLGGGQVGLLSYRVNLDGSLTQNGPAVLSGSIRPQYMALWSPPPFCIGDSNRDGSVNFGDVALTLSNIGGVGPIGDADGDGSIDFKDITAVLSSLGTCEPSRS